MLKMSFPVSGADFTNVYEIPGSFINRPANGEEEPAQRWGAVCFNDGGQRALAVLNDSKYSYDCPDNDFRITLLRNVIFADHYSNRPEADFNFTDEGMQRFEYGVFVCDGAPQEQGVVNEAALFNARPVAVPASYHKGKLPQRQSLIEISKNNILMTAFKLCEDGSDDCILRCYESAGKETRVNILIDMLDCAFRADFMPHEVKTFRIDTNGMVTEVDFLEGIVR